MKGWYLGVSALVWSFCGGYVYASPAPSGQEKEESTTKKEESTTQKAVPKPKKAPKRRKTPLSGEVQVHYVSQMTGAYRVVAARFRLCQRQVVCTIFRIERPYLSSPMKKHILIFQDKLKPGIYLLKVDARISGYHPVFTYMKGYKAAIKNELPFRVHAGKPLTIHAKFVDQGGGGGNFKKRIKQIKIIFEMLPPQTLPKTKYPK